MTEQNPNVVSADGTAAKLPNGVVAVPASMVTLPDQLSALCAGVTTPAAPGAMMDCAGDTLHGMARQECLS